MTCQFGANRKFNLRKIYVIRSWGKVPPINCRLSGLDVVDRHAWVQGCEPWGWVKHIIRYRKWLDGWLGSLDLAMFSPEGRRPYFWKIDCAWLDERQIGISVCRGYWNRMSILWYINNTFLPFCLHDLLRLIVICELKFLYSSPNQRQVNLNVFWHWYAICSIRNTKAWFGMIHDSVRQFLNYKFNIYFCSSHVSILNIR